MHGEREQVHTKNMQLFAISSNSTSRILKCALLKRDQTCMHPDDLQKLVTFAMPYGKYKGRMLADLPGHYLGWFAREGFPKGELGMLLALMYELDHNALRHLLDPLRIR